VSQPSPTSVTEKPEGRPETSATEQERHELPNARDADISGTSAQIGDLD
jgi:hypothetical protein